MTEPLKARYDAVVVGARAAGAATAMLLARRGLSVLAIDRGVRGSDTLSTHALMRAGVLQLARWGLLDALEAAGTPRVHHTVFHYEGGDVVDIPIRAKNGVPALFAPRRTVLDPLLVDAAAAAGAEVLHGMALQGLVRGAGGRVEGARLKDAEGRASEVRADIVIGADGVRSAVAALVDAPETRSGRHAAASIYGYWRGLPADGYHWYWAKGSAAGAIPTNNGEVLLFAGVSRDAFHEMRLDVPRGYMATLARTAPDLVDSLELAARPERLFGFPGRAGFLRRPWGPGWALVGDAGYFKDPISAHGISDALRDAELLADAVARGGEQALADYEEERDALSAGLFDVTDRIASCSWDTPALKELHENLADEMKAEVEALLRRSPPPALALAS